MDTSQIIPPKHCVICGTPFTPVKRAGHVWSQTCRTRSCRTALGRQHPTWQGSLAKAVQARRQQAIDRRQQAVREEFGELSEREHALFERGYQAGYKSGWTAALKPAKPADREA